MWLGEQNEHVRAVMQEEGCGKCIGCPIAMLAAKSIANQAWNQLHVAATTQNAESDLFTKGEKSLSRLRADLAEYTRDCDGYEGAPEPSEPAWTLEYCSSPILDYPRQSVLAGKILKFFNL